ncbi:MAG: hypothetical protein K6F82_05290 [Sphaerochaetaceae bacterium]|nr:hypothetical protein [Sphaerochaetaceae bacterium]
MTDKIYSSEFKILSSDTDIYRRLRISRLFSMFQEATIAHTQALGAGREKTLDKGYLWIVAMQSATVERLPVYDEEVVLKTWPGKSMHMFFPRYSTLEDKEGNVLVRSSALWLLINAKTRKMIVPDKIGVSIEGVVTGSETALPKSIKAVQKGKKFDFTVPYSYTDLNEHMNNTRYFDLAEDCMASSLRKKRVKSVSAEYTSEIKMNQSFQLLSKTENGVYTATGVKDEKKLFSLRFEYEN